VLIAGVAGLVAGAPSMAAGEYVSVSSQADTERADRDRERRELAESPADELDELTDIYIQRGLEPDLARTVAQQLSDRDSLRAHVRDELGQSEDFAARPLQAALASAATFAVGAALPLATAALAPYTLLSWLVAAGVVVQSGGTVGVGRLRRRRVGTARGVACHILGRVGHGVDRGRRRPVRGGGLSTAATPIRV
jgi:vacuolar iron transporter family protein